MQIRFNSDDNLPQKNIYFKILKLYNLIITFRSVFFFLKKQVLSTFFLRWMFVWIINATIR